MGSDLREHLLQQGVTSSKATFCGEQYDPFLQALQRDDRPNQAPAQPLSDSGDHRKGTVR